MIKIKIKGIPFMTTRQQISQINYNDFEPFSIELLKRYILPKSTFLDIGAHHGYYSTIIGKSIEDVKIIAIEPIKENFLILKNNLKLNNIKALNLYNIAASNKNENKVIDMAKTTSRSSFYNISQSDKLKTVTIKTQALDELIKKRVDFIKIDVEGHEIPTLEGLNKIISKNQSLKILIEFNPYSQIAAGYNPIDLLNKLKSLNFELYLIYEYHHQLPEISDEKIKIPSIRKITNDVGRWKSYINEKYNNNIIAFKKNKSFNVLFFNHTAGLGGSERSLLELIDEFQELDVICHAVLPYDGPLSEELKKRAVDYEIIEYHWWCQQQEINPEEQNRRMNESFVNLMGKKTVLDRWDPDLIFTNTLTIPWGSLYAQMTNKPHITFIREYGDLDFDFKFFYGHKESLDFINENSDFVFTNSKATLSHFKKNIDNKKLDYAYTYINIDKKLVTEKSKKMFKNKMSLKLVLSGAIMPSKGQKDAILAVAELVKKGKKDIELLIIGTKHDKIFSKKLDKIIKTNKISGNIKFVNFVNNPFPYINQADILLMCSKSEAYGRVTIEGMALKKPVVGSNSGATKELIKDNYNGLLYKQGDYFDLAKKIEYFYDNRSKIKQLGNNAYAFYKNTFNKEIYGKKIYDFMKKILKNKKKINIRLQTFFSNYKNSQESRVLELENKIKEQNNLQNIIQNDLEEKNKKIEELNNSLSKIYSSKMWKLLYLYKKIFSIKK